MSYCHVTKEHEVAAPKKIISIPLFHKDDNYACSTACMAAILQYFSDGVEMKERQLADLIQATQGNEMTVEEMVSYINQVSFEEDGKRALMYANLSRYMTVCDLISDIDNGIPVICPIQAWYTDSDGNYDAAYEYKDVQEFGHFVVAVGYDNEKIYFMDPAQAEAYSYIPIKELDKRWHEKENGIEYERCGIEVVMNKVRQDAVWVYKIM